MLLAVGRRGLEEGGSLFGDLPSLLSTISHYPVRYMNLSEFMLSAKVPWPLIDHSERLAEKVRQNLDVSPTLLDRFISREPP